MSLIIVLVPCEHVSAVPVTEQSPGHVSRLSDASAALADLPTHPGCKAVPQVVRKGIRDFGADILLLEKLPDYSTNALVA